MIKLNQIFDYIKKAGMKIKADNVKAENVRYLKIPIKINKILNYNQELFRIKTNTRQ